MRALGPGERASRNGAAEIRPRGSAEASCERIEPCEFLGELDRHRRRGSEPCVDGVQRFGDLGQRWRIPPRLNAATVAGCIAAPPSPHRRVVNLRGQRAGPSRRLRCRSRSGTRPGHSRPRRFLRRHQAPRARDESWHVRAGADPPIDQRSAWRQIANAYGERDRARDQRGRPEHVRPALRAVTGLTAT
jgi:hypothetical protein